MKHESGALRLSDTVTDTAATAYIGVQLLWEKILGQFLSSEDWGAHQDGGGQVPLTRPAQGVQGTHDWTKGVLNAPNGNAILGAEHCLLTQCSPILSFL